MCKPALSTALSRVNRRLGLDFEPHYEFDLKKIEPYIHQVKSLSVSGGNPTQDPQILTLLNRVSANKEREHVMLTTNGMTPIKDYLIAMSKFPDWLLTFSIDGDIETGDWLRRFTSAEKTYKRINEALKFRDSVSETSRGRVVIQYTVSNVSVYKFREFFDEAIRLTDLTKVGVMFNVVTWPKEMAVWNMSEEKKDELRTHLLRAGKYISEFYDLYPNAVIIILRAMNGSSNLLDKSAD